MKKAVVFFLLLHISAHLCGAVVTRNDRIWPIGKSSSVDLPQSLAYGSRVKSSGKYDFHPGVDVNSSSYASVYAIADGTVRIGGSSSFYSSAIVQLKHTNWEENPSGYFYSNYQKIVMSNGTNTISLIVGQEIKKGDVIAYTASKPAGALVTIHFEIRAGGTSQKYSCNPWKYMPNSANSYSSLNSTLSLTPNYNSINCEAVVNVSVPPDQLTFTRVELHITDTSDQPQEVRLYDMCGANSNHTTKEMDNWQYNSSLILYHSYFSGSLQ